MLFTSKSNCYNGKYGSICGIHPSTLPTEILQEVDLEKLLECVGEDNRIEDIVSGKINKMSLKKMNFMGRISETAIFKFPKLLQAYNNCVEKNNHELEGSYSFRGDYIKFNLLNETNKLNEAKRWLLGQDSVINYYTVDYSFLFNHFPDLAEKHITKLLTDKYSDSQLKRVIETLPDYKMLEYFPIILKSKPKLSMYMLANPKTPRDYILKALKTIGNKVKIPTVKVKVDADIIKDLPTITRLDVVETLLNHVDTTNFAQNFKSENELANLLFSSTIRYPDRVERAVRLLGQQIKFQEKGSRII